MVGEKYTRRPHNWIDPAGSTTAELESPAFWQPERLPAVILRDYITQTAHRAQPIQHKGGAFHKVPGIPLEEHLAGCTVLVCIYLCLNKVKATLVTPLISSEPYSYDHLQLVLPLPTISADHYLG